MAFACSLPWSGLHMPITHITQYTLHNTHITLQSTLVWAAHAHYTQYTIHITQDTHYIAVYLSLGCTCPLHTLHNTHYTIHTLHCSLPWSWLHMPITQYTLHNTHITLQSTLVWAAHAHYTHYTIHITQYTHYIAVYLSLGCTRPGHQGFSCTRGTVQQNTCHGQKQCTSVVIYCEQVELVNNQLVNSLCYMQDLFIPCSIQYHYEMCKIN